MPPALVVSAWAGFAFASAVVKTPNVARTADFFLAAARGFCRPEPAEQLGYVLAALISCAALLGLARLSRHASIVRAWWLEPFAVFAQLAALAWVVICWVELRRWQTAVALVAGALGALLMARASGARPSRSLAVAASSACVGAVVLGLTPAIIADRALMHAPAIVRYHLPFTMGEFAAVANGRTPLVDLHPQYVALLPVLLRGLVRTDSVLAFTLGMSALSAIGLGATWTALYLAARSVTRASLLLLCVFGWSYFSPADGIEGVPPVASEIAAGERAYVYDYFANAPLRTVLPAIALALTVSAVRSRSRGAFVWVGIASGMAALNNTDFGLVSLVASLAVVTLDGADTLRARAKASAFTLAGAALGVTFGVVLLGAHAHAVPNLANASEYARVFSTFGFMMLPLPPGNLQYAMFATHLAAIAVSRVRRSGTQHADVAVRTRSALLLSAGLTGLGTGMYYVGRSHPDVLYSLLGAWALSVAALAIECFDALRHAAPKARRMLLIPTLGVAYLLALGASMLRALPSPAEELARWRHDDPRLGVWLGGLERELRTATRAGEAVVIVYPEGHRLASRVGLNDVFPFVHQGSLILQGQVEATCVRIEAAHVSRVFGSPPPELSARLDGLGFKRTRVLRASDADLRRATYVDFETWER
jgi:hypothetical protein